jgi:hypothetical protein
MTIFGHLTAAVLCGLSLLPSIYGLPLGLLDGAQKVRGVNIGGWLVLEVYSSNVCFYFLHMLMGSCVWPPAMDHPFSL